MERDRLLALLTISTLLLLAGSFGGACASAPVEPRPPSPTRYEVARDYIVRIHQKALFGDQDPWVIPEFAAFPLMPPDGLPPSCYPDSASRTVLTSPSCVFDLDEYFLDTLEKKYFAATRLRIFQACQEHSLACGDPVAFEYVVRSVHNQEIRDSMAGKLDLLRRWKLGQASDDDLLYELGKTSWDSLQVAHAGRN